MRSLRVAVTEAPVAGRVPGSAPGASWSPRRAASIAAQIADEYAALFLGVGKPEVFLYGSFYLAGRLNDKPLVALRDDLRALGLERREAITETEDHIASLCEVMRYLIAGDDVGVEQPGARSSASSTPTCAAGSTRCATPWKRIRGPTSIAALARFTRDFFAVEAQAFDLLDA